MIISISVILLGAMLVASVFFGFFAGRLSVGRNEDDEEEEAVQGDPGGPLRGTFPENLQERFHKKNKREEAEGACWSVGSPVSGNASAFREGEMNGVAIQPMEDRLYAPTGGKIIRLYPMGNAFLFRTEFGAELYIRVGRSTDELLGRHYRSRIVQNEIVTKGKLLLEFDRRGLAAEGENPEVYVCVESFAYGAEVIITAQGQVRTGEEILMVREAPEPDGIRRGSRSTVGETP